MCTVKSYIISYCVALLCFCCSQLNAQKPVWVNQLTGAGGCDAHACKVAPNGNIYIAGNFSGTVDIDPGANVYNLYSKGADDIFLACYTTNGSFIWGIAVGGAGKDLTRNLAVDKDNNPIIVGEISGQNIDFDPSPNFKYLHARGPVDGFVAKYTAGGAFVWGTNVGGKSAHDNTLSVATDANANIYIGGDFHEDMDIDPAPFANYTLSSLSGTAYLIKYSSSGQLVWGFNFGAGGLAGVDNTVWSINASENGHVYIAGCFEGQHIDFNPSATSAYYLSTVAGYDAFVAKYTDAGLFEFATGIGGQRVEQAFDMTLDDNNNIYVTGYTESPSLDFGNLVVANAPVANNKSDIFLAKYNSIGQCQWGYIIGGAGTDVGWGVAVHNNKLYCTGYFIDTMDADPTAGIEILKGYGDNEAFIAKYELNGDFICAFNIGGAQTDVGRKIAFDKAGNLLISGLFMGAGVEFDPFTTSYILNGQGIDGFFAKYDWNNVYTPPAGYLIGDTICSGRNAYFTLIATAGNNPFTITYTDGVTDYIQPNVMSGVPFQLNKSPKITTTYKLKRIKGAGLCAPSAEPNTPVTILVYPTPNADAGADTNVCPGAMIQLHGSGAGDYEWYPPEGISNPYIADPLLFVAENTIRRIIVSNNYGCKDTNAVTIELIPFDFKAKPRYNLCIGDTLRLSASGGSTYKWLPANDMDNDLIPQPLAWPVTSREYSVLIKDTVCSRLAELNVEVAVHPLPDIKIIQAKDVDCGLKAGMLSAIGGISYKWYPANTLNDAHIPNPVALPGENTMYVVTGIDANGCANKDSAEIKVFSGNGRLYAPTAFTPNRDGKNDCFHVIVPGDISDFELSVYNRFGQMVFHSNNYNSCWDGRFNNANQPLGTYFYYYKAHSSICDEVFGKGDVQLVR